MSYHVKYNRTTNHIAGIPVRTEGTDLNYSLSACATLTRSASQLASGPVTENLDEAIKIAQKRGGRKICRTCLTAAEAAK